MKIALSKYYGGFALSHEACELLNCERYSYINPNKSDRTNPKLIEVIEELGTNASWFDTKMEVIDIPAEATDYKIYDYDGWETLIYVIDGKIHTDKEITNR